MKKLLNFGVVISIAALMLLISGCSKADKSYGVESETQSVTETSLEKNADKAPVIMSSDSVMPNYVDISQYDEENYANIYLGKNFKFKINYAGTEFTVPSSYKTMTKNGWEFIENSEYDGDSLILACESVEATFINSEGKKITAVFYNSSNSSVIIKKCNIVKFIIDNNSLYTQDTAYGNFSVNGITNHSAITDIIETLGSPSHFYAVASNEYYLDYFISKEDRRNGITVYVDPTNDSVNSIEFSYYE